MVDTPNIKVTHIEVGQTSKETTANTGFDRFDTSNNDFVDIDCSAGGTIVVTEAQYLDNILLRLTGTPVGAFFLDVPDGKRAFKVKNNSGQSATVETVTGGTTVVVANTASADIVSRGTDLEFIVSDTPGGALFGRMSEVFPAGAMWFPGTQPAGALVAREVSANNPSVPYIPFIDTSETRAHFGGVPFPNRWNGSTITFEVGYTHQGGQTGGLDGVSWELKAVAIADDGTFDVAFGTGVNVTLDRANANDVHRTAESSVVTVGGTPGDADTVYFQIARDTADVADDLNINAELLWVRIFWTEDAAVDD
jgi:hypothetical protein